MGFTATQVKEMSLWELSAQSEGYADAHTPEDKQGMSKDVFDALGDDIDKSTDTVVDPDG